MAATAATFALARAGASAYFLAPCSVQLPRMMNVAMRPSRWPDPRCGSFRLTVLPPDDLDVDNSTVPPAGLSCRRWEPSRVEQRTTRRRTLHARHRLVL